MDQQFCGDCGADLRTTSNPPLVESSSTQVANPNPLPQIPVLSLELMNLEELGDRLKTSGQLARVTKDLTARIESQLISQNATVDSIRDNVVFFSFCSEPGPKEALAKALKVGIALAKKVITLQNVNITLRVGLDYVSPTDKGPMTAVPERMVAHPGQLVVSATVHQLSKQQLPFDPIGPIKVQGQMQTFYRVLTDGQKPGQQSAPATGEPMPGAPPVSAVGSPDEPIERKFEPLERPGDLSYAPPQFITVQLSPKNGNIGYQQAILALENELNELTASPTPQGKLVALCGHQGYGKTTIINMVRAKMPQDAFIWMGGSFYQNQSSPLSFWLELIQNLFGWPLEGVNPQQGEEHLVNVLKSMFGDNYAEEKANFYRNLMAIIPIRPITPDTRQLLGRIIPEVKELLVSLTQMKPLVMVMDNLEYADPASVELFLQLLQEELLQSKVLVIMTYQPNVAFTGPLQQALTLMPFKEYVLDPADEGTLVAMAEPPLAVPWKKLPDSLRAQLLEKGSPIFLEEAFRWLQMEGGFSIHAKTGKFNPEKPLKNLTVPEDVQQIIQERFAKLDDLCRYVLQMASILGERFSTQTLAELTQVPEHFEELLKFLWQNGFIMPDVGTIARFRHHLIWQIAYSSMDQELRQKSHQLVADYLEQARLQGQCLPPIYLAHHYALAHDTEEAIKGWNLAGVWYANLGSVTAANMAFLNMQNLMASSPVPADPVHQKRLYESLGILNLDMNPEYAKNLLLSAIALKGLSEDEEQIQLQLFLGQAYEGLGAYIHAMSTVHRALEAMPASQASLERAALGCQEMWYLYLQGRYQEALLVYDETVKPALEQSGESPWVDPGIRQSYFKGELARARIGLMQCNAKAFDMVDVAVTQCDIHDEQMMALHFRLTRSWGYLLKGNNDGFQREMEDILTEIESLGHPPDVMVWWGLIVLMYHCDMGDWENASMLLPNTSYQAEQARDYLAWCICQAMAGRIAMEAGNYGEAQKLLEQAVTVSAEYSLSLPALMGWRYIAENELKVENLDVAEQLCTRAMDVALKPHNRNLAEFYQLVLTLAKIQMARNELKQAGTMLEKQWPNMVRSGYQPIVAEAAFQISELYGRLLRVLPEAHRGKYLTQQKSFLSKAKTLWQQQGNKYRLAPFLKEDSVPIS